MKYLPLLALCLAFSACKERIITRIDHIENVSTDTETSSDLTKSVVRINATSQSWNPGQPWEKNPPQSLRSLGAIVAPGQVLTSGEVVADATYLELENPDGSRSVEAKIIAVDYESNLALLSAKNEEEGADFFTDTTPLSLAEAPTIGDTLQAFQVEENGTTLLTSGILQSVDVSGSFLPRQAFLTYLVKASMQSAASSFSLPVLKDGKLAGILLSYDSEDQISDVLSVDVLSRFLKNAKDETYSGFPTLGIGVARTNDPSFRDFLKLTDDQGGLYVSTVRPGGAADLAGLKKGDVVLSAGGFPIDRRGYYEHPHYGSLSWGHLVRGERSAGDEITLAILRDGEPMEITATLTREEPGDSLVPEYQFDRAPNFLVKGGLIFQELTRPTLEAFGKDWTSVAPLNLLDAYENPEKYEDSRERVIFLSGSIPTPATVGYERLRNLIVKKVNGIEIDSMKTLIEAFDKPGANNLHSIEFLEENFTVYLDEAISTGVDTALLQRGLTRLSRAE
ncbi:MAG: serine protease [Akkermansiaceae bacterium]|jgi:S1-C subfamily serine protease|nr:serine protease [Akkermansiaceae bacterium]MDP4646027.1 serine protease [Akkermansiaceae bacterium]MDP4721994.1 serine protease [Akkermansiaceae bacterium]MDP4780815.1 serine protease [Akkermansiaceae bacterium]MDP4847850.1 serine protease [Akkermansiaceae bacterium]